MPLWLAWLLWWLLLLWLLLLWLLRLLLTLLGRLLLSGLLLDLLGCLLLGLLLLHGGDLGLLGDDCLWVHLPMVRVVLHLVKLLLVLLLEGDLLGHVDVVHGLSRHPPHCCDMSRVHLIHLSQRYANGYLAQVVVLTSLLHHGSPLPLLQLELGQPLLLL